MSTTPKIRFVQALERQPLSGRVPHFELVFFLTMEAFGKVHPAHRSFHQWDQMSEKERQLHRKDMAEIQVRIAEVYDHSAIFVYPNPGSVEENCRQADLIREQSGDDYFLMTHGDATMGVPGGAGMMDLIGRLADEPEKVKAEAEASVAAALERAEEYKKHGALDGFALCSDYCLNTGPFLSPSMFSEFVTPYLAKLIAGYRSMGFYTIKHTDGNIMPIFDQLVQANPHALHSLDPQAGVDIKQVKELAGDRLCLLRNVNCGLFPTGTDDEVIASARYALKHGMPGGGYIFSTSNCVYTGMPLERYHLMLKIWKEEGNYAAS